MIGDPERDPRWDARDWVILALLVGFVILMLMIGASLDPSVVCSDTRPC